MIYFDNAATTLNKPEQIKKSVMYAIKNFSANPGRSGHEMSLKTLNMVYETREILKGFFNAKEYNVIFTKNCTEALNLAILGTLKDGDHVIATVYEHNSVLRTLESLKQKGVEVSFINSDLDDFHNRLEKEIKLNTKMVITTAISNVNGEQCNLYEVGSICKNYNLIYLVDGAQACGHIKIDMKKCNISMLAFAGHKGLLSITGVGGLVIKECLKLAPIMFGGTGTESENLVQPSTIPEGFECGTLPTIPIASLNAGTRFIEENFEKIYKKEQILIKKLVFELKKINFIEIYSKDNCSNVISFNVKNQDCMLIANELNELGICVRSGLHCSPLAHKKLGTFETGSIRVSIDFQNTEKEIEMLINALKFINQKLSF